jgi:hypothetical protein
MITRVDPGGTTINRAEMGNIVHTHIANLNIIVPTGKGVETETAGWSTSTEMENIN